MDIQLTAYPILVLTSSYQVDGTLTPRGRPNIFLNDAQYEAISVDHATLKPIMQGARLGPMTMAQLHMSKREIQIVRFGEFTVADAQLLASARCMVCFTDTYIVRGEFPTSPETKAVDLFYSGNNVFYGVKDAEVFPLRALASDVSFKAELAFLNRDAVVAFYSEE